MAILMALLLDGCSAERKNVLSKTYHNTTARYNAYFYAKKRIKEIEAVLKENVDNDYNNILRIYPEIDSTLATTYQEKIDDCIKKASIAIQRHKNSKWVDDSYIFIGRARLYSLDYVNAIETFKFVNTESEDDDARHEALIRLLRTFVDYQEFENAVAVEDYIKKEKLNKQNQKLLYLNQAHHYQVKEDYNKMVSNLVLAAPLLKRKDGKGRIYFIIGQIYQELGFDAEAFNYYRKCLASNPEYELDFYTRLNMAQVTELGKSSDVRAARKVLNSLLKDSKNKEFKDKIYFEIAEFELKQGNRDKAIDNFESSIASSIGNQRQKGQSYLRLGEVYYDTLRSYELAQAYYDSAIQALPQDFENITSIKARQQVLGEFVKNLKTIEVQDSILRLSTLDSAAITAKLNSYLDEQAEKRKEQQKKEERKARRTQASAFNSNTGISSTGWYFGNPSAVALGQSEFKRIWGERPLEDNWRRSIKESVQSLNVNSTPTDVVENTDVANGQTSANIDAGANLNALYREIPFSEDAKQESLNKIEAAYYALGNIYKYDLEEDVNSADAFKTLITRFPETENKPEALYQLYLIYKELNNEEYNTYKNELLNDFPNTVYAKLIANPNYTEESTATNEKLKKIYEKAYGYFTQENYDTTLYILNDAIENYEETVFTSRLKLLKILVTGKTEDINLYQYQLSEFIKSNPDSEVAPYAEELLTASRSFLERKRKRLGTEYVKYLEQSHYLVYVYELKSGLTDAISQAIDNYNGKFSGLNLKTSNLILNDELAMILVSDFENKIDAFQYYSDFIKSDPIDEAKRNSKFYKFVITKDNFNIFYQSKDLDAYLKFFEKNYINGIN
ncbi:methyltransferase [Fulvivirga lutimaris]|uniref:type IX secretion system periplasmic lipoprotein PorW/SprE n=1 Tax=Fulvivirga lutimaris TaxID=1819566 RepID=UPI0012BBD79E|nr:methyltransferase [Fulvivirga lutimaris]